jgi:cobyrinic acid a,c-diamide synthase
MSAGLVIAAPASGSGKTVFTLGLLRSLARSGVAVVSAKAGPDYIDPAFHAAASGRPCINLDPWAMRPETLDAAAADLLGRSDLVVCEGVMGLFDGATVTAGSTADLAQRLGWPVILVVDAHAQAASAAAVVRGFATHRPGLAVAGVVFNRVGSARHAAILSDACTLAMPEIPVLGCLPRAEGLVVPSRHLGLVQALEHPDLEAFLDHAAALIAEHVDIQALRRIAIAHHGRATSKGTSTGMGMGRPLLPPPGQRIAVAGDVAFAFSYPLVIAGWRAAGAEILPFSPLADEAPSADSDAVYLPGGYPELYPGRLAGNAGFIAGVHAAARRGAAVFGECGGYMVLGDGMIDGDGIRHRMLGLLPLETSFAERRLHLGYRAAVLAVGTALGGAGARFRGHEFHYATVIREGPGQALFACADASGRVLGQTGLVSGTVMGSFLHLIDAGGVD